jgi:hypothetical protein
LGSSLSWILVEEETPRQTARGDKKGMLGMTKMDALGDKKDAQDA